MSNIKDVARLAEVSVSTVSRVLNNQNIVQEALKLRVLSAAKQLNYSANRIAKSLKECKTNVIAIVTTSIERVFFTDIIQEITKTFLEKGYLVEILETHDQPALEIRIIRTLHEQWVDGIVLISSITKNTKVTAHHIENLHLLKKKNIKIPVINLEVYSLNPYISSVVIDHEDAAYKATSHLLEIGRKNIVHIALPKHAPMVWDRISGYKRALKEFNIPYNPKRIIHGDFSVQSGYTIAQQLHKAGTGFDGIFSGNDQMGLGAHRACKDMGLNIPSDVAIVGHDDIEIASLIDPPLSTIRVPKQKMGHLAANQLLAMLANPEMLIENIKIDTELIVRASTMLSAQKNFEMLL